MTTHRRAWALRVGVVAALASGALLGAAGPARADAPTIEFSLSSGTLQAGQSATLTFRVRNNNNPLPPRQNSATIKVTLSLPEVTCKGNCDLTQEIQPGTRSDQFTATLVASNNIQPGQTKSGKVQISATINGETGTVERDLTVRGPDQAPSIKKISGTVRDSANSDPIDGANVSIKDSKGQRFETQTDNGGRWEFESTQDKPIAPGRIAITVNADGFGQITKNQEVGAGQSKTGLKIVLQSTTQPSASATPDPSTAPPPEQSGGPDATGPAVNNASGEQGDSGSSAFTWVMIILGGLLVALGVGAIVLLVVRRKEDAADEEGGVGAVPPGGGPVPQAHGAYHGGGADPTRVVNQAGMGAAPTMMARPGLADAQTMYQRPVPVDDEFPDPYGAPPPGRQQPGWGGGGYPVNGAPQPGYGEPAPAGYGAREFGPPDAGYQDRYDEPTGRFNGAAVGGYEPPQAYQPPGGGYDQRGQYDDGGYDGRDGYEDQRGQYDARGDGYAQPGGGGYEPPAGYEPAPAYQPPGGGYEPRGGYGQGDFDGGPDQQRGGYEPRGGGQDQGGYYEEPGARSRHGAPPPPPAGRGERRQLDWLDD